jgi:hypothetical protein
MVVLLQGTISLIYTDEGGTGMGTGEVLLESDRESGLGDDRVAKNQESTVRSGSALLAL